MLDAKFIVEHAELVKQNCRNRGVPADAEVDRFVQLEAQRRTKQAEWDELNRQANQVAKQIGQAKDAAQQQALKERGRQLREAAAQAKSALDAIQQEMLQIQKRIPNMTHPDAPVGDGSANRICRFGRTPVRQFDFPPLDHVQLAEKLDLLDLEAGARVAGHGFYFLKNEAVLLELALQRYAVGELQKEGFTLMITPDLARNEILEGIGFLPRGPETQIYSIEGTDLGLIATAEITLGGMFADQILEAEQLPMLFAGISHCFRTEAGAHGRATRGLYRVHQFTKVEMFAFTLPDQSDSMLERFCELECRLFDGLGIPYRVIDTATGELGGPAYRKYDLEAWMPGRGEWGEITSTSNCTDYQARRLGIRYRSKGEKGTRFVHTLNGTAIAISRTLLAILENYQQADGSVVIPEVLRAWVGKDRIEPKR
ncbi:MAG: serine--tRNA ligase [Thermoguttaceae bacterium]|nr:serine--tRNA ligase [Thermoguttaceae bacterium]MDW8036978.1 serine--tRNA ligase [Thermoguttaceae bacterium]